MEIKKEPEVIPEDTPKTEPAGQTDKAEQTDQTEPAPAGKPEAAPKEKPHKKNKGEAKAEALQAEIDQLKAELETAGIHHVTLEFESSAEHCPGTCD